MNTTRVLHDVNLAEIAFAKEGQELVLTFLNMIDGHAVGVVNCTGVLVLEYHTALSSLPLYVGEVNLGEMTIVAEGQEVLNRLNYSFFDSSGTVLRPSRDTLHFLQVEGGEVRIQIVCEELRFLASMAPPQS